MGLELYKTTKKSKKIFLKAVKMIWSCTIFLKKILFIKRLSEVSIIGKY